MPTVFISNEHLRATIKISRIRHRKNSNITVTFRFTKAGFQHEDLFFTDGSTPSDSILQQFLEICEKAPGNEFSYKSSFK